ncbi:phosphotransferase [Catalinimonas niigatensis]|uniref:phosphotransferase n=1 Tax=Catalinimonas niigatensis TaxID=1397264 RepID=UPI002666C916|nr:phosphotransferase [Catalinimonas niigatensis]WPP51383.1 phosphotransferase [Catalinimonas niigatensis]
MNKTFPVTESTISALHLSRWLQEKYQLSARTVCSLFRTGMNHLYLVTDGERKFVLRIYTYQWRSRMEIAEELRLLLHLRQHDIPVSYPIADQQGELIQELHAPEGIRYGVLFSFAEGKKNPKFSAQTSYQIGVALAKLHRATENFSLERITYSSKTLLQDSLHPISAFFSGTEEMKFVERLSHYLFQEYAQVNTKQIRQGAVHLDIWFDNMHVYDEDRITLFDFDFCGNGWQCHDIAYFIFQLFNTHPEEEYQTKKDRFLQGYASITPITEEEKRIIPITGLGVMLFYLGIQCDRFDTWSNIFLNEDHLKRFTGMLKRWITHHQLAVE